MKNTLISITAVMLFIAVFYCFAQKKEIQLDKSIRVLNFSGVSYLDTIVNVGVSTMKIKEVNIIILPFKFEDTLNPLLLGYIEYSGSYYIIRLKSNLSKEENILILSHELIHLLQEYSGRLLITDNSIIFDGRYYSPYIPYFNRLWEIEAFILESQLATEINKKLNP